MSVPRCRTVLLKALSAAGAVLVRRFGKVKVSVKARANLLTEADLESQRLILSLIRRSFPEHDVIAEEGHASLRGSEFLWIVDPLDGTTNYAHGFPAFTVSIGLLRRGSPLLGGVFDPSSGETFFAEAGKGAYLNGRRMRVSSVAKLSESLLITGFPYDRHRRSSYYTGFYAEFLELCHDIRRSGSAARDLAWIAAGRADGFWEFGLSPWDAAAGLLLVREAGGQVTDFRGSAWKRYQDYGKQTLATNGRVHGRMLSVIKPMLRGGD
ncbi:MAG: inositol monophosphatase [Elusimicrobia bacterium]|nr:inositol monophosphatase [Elusimicrobiota bacterium]